VPEDSKISARPRLSSTGDAPGTENACPASNAVPRQAVKRTAVGAHSAAIGRGIAILTREANPLRPLDADQVREKNCRL